jgi:formylglycine-generating enzyme required for sulfatase activity
LHEVTVGEFAGFVAQTGYRTQAEEAALIGHTPMSRARTNEPMMTWRRPGTFTQSDRHPVVCVSVRDAEAFCRWLSDMDGTIHRLPTANEWDYVANVGGTSSGSAFEPPDAVMGSNNIPFRTRRAGLGDVNPLGLIDLHGNVAEWCLDDSDAPKGVVRGDYVEGQSPEAQSSETQSPEAQSPETWNDEAHSETWFHSNVGFRVVQMVPGG